MSAGSYKANGKFYVVSNNVITAKESFVANKHEKSDRSGRWAQRDILSDWFVSLKLRTTPDQTT